MQDAPFSAAAKAVLEGAEAVARQLGLKYISTDAIVIALVNRAKRPDTVVDFLARCATNARGLRTRKPAPAEANTQVQGGSNGLHQQKWLLLRSLGSYLLTFTCNKCTPSCDRDAPQSAHCPGLVDYKAWLGT